MTKGPSIDPDTLMELRELSGDGDPSFFANLMTLFLEAVANESAALEEALSRKDLPGVRNRAHALKSSSLNVGATALGGLCQSLEKAAGEESLAEVGRLMLEFREEADAAAAEVRRLPELATRV